MRPHYQFMRQSDDGPTRQCEMASDYAQLYFAAQTHLV